MGGIAVRRFTGSDLPSVADTLLIGGPPVHMMPISKLPDR
jgi:hypothetical protein